MKYHDFEVESFSDHRASRYFDLFPELPGQITTSVIEKNQFSGWHKHQLQYDQFFVTQGKIKVGIITPEGKVLEEILTSNRPRTIFIPPGYWHCYHSMDERAILIYYLSRKHNEDDELRATEEQIFKQYKYKITF